MNVRVLLAIADDSRALRARTLLEESGDVVPVATVLTAGDVPGRIASGDIDVVVLDEGLGPLPVLDLARDLNRRFPQVGAVLLSDDESPGALRAAMGAGIRAVVPVPFTFADLHGAVVDASEWARSVRERLSRPDEDRADRANARVVAVAGSKGGVGTTTVAVHLALELQRRNPDRRVCLVDLDLQTGDVRSYLDIAFRRGITSLTDVAAELTTSHLTDAMYVHDSGLHVLLPPGRGEDAEDLHGDTAGRILGGIRARFDHVVLDVGAVQTEAGSVATELADDVVVVCTPDVVSLRGANRLLALWQRLNVRDDRVQVLVNRASGDREVQPQLAAKVVHAPVLDTTIPAGFDAIEAAANTGVPERLDGALRGAFHDLVSELWAVRSPTPVARTEPTRVEERVAADEFGVVSVEFVALLGGVVIVLAFVWQFVLAGYTTVLAEHAAREGARELTVGADHAAVAAVVLDDLPGAWRDGARVAPIGSDSDAVTVTVPVPLLLPGVTSPWEISTTAGALRESDGRSDP